MVFESDSDSDDSALSFTDHRVYDDMDTEFQNLEYPFYNKKSGYDASGHAEKACTFFLNSRSKKQNIWTLETHL